ncbi:SDR family NAD(P)-dependent oxidoreductase [Pseudosporangium ferrugineum]|uniref:Short-subunit dehydrogenase n=1 Tax=Pseudosporangium ferrugineum TaxID=439699 RepID=A0A2T0SB41_9ACTN|nr:SDR family oxidoreductase [Pseudosporangium ferrugineum]PRY30543.1 short-subunit dehydrogenase [Pseudosporangium ferrugineum]
MTTTSTRVALVAGAGGGLGRATAAALHAAGLIVVAVDRTAAKLHDLPAGVHREIADATDPAALPSLMDRVVAAAGPPDVLVNTLGAHGTGDFSTVTPEGLRALMDVNLGAALWLTQAVAPYMRRRGAGVIIHTGARPGVEPAAGAAAYGITKAALAHLGRVLDLELRPHGIRVNVILPQLIATAANRAALPPRLLAHAVAPEALAGLITVLAGDASAPVSGGLIPAYGG